MNTSCRAAPELVAPAGDWAALTSALESGADSVYFGVKGLTMRNLAGNFDILEIPKVMEYVHGRGRRGYLALNVVIYNHELTTVERIIASAQDAGVDAVIGWDAAVIQCAVKHRLPLHLSTQASVANVAALEWYAERGARRVVLARECTLNDIRDIIAAVRKKRIPVAVEAFVHGAMCVSISGRCFLSALAAGKSANRGECLQVCRRRYTIRDAENESAFELGAEYVLSARDLCTVEFIDRLIDAGIDALKIEGRRRAPEYVRVVTAVYRQAIDACRDNSLNAEKKKALRTQLQTVFNRGFSPGFYFGAAGDPPSAGLENTHEKVYLGEVVKFFKKINVAEIRLSNQALVQHDELMFIGNKTPVSLCRAEEIQQEHVFVSGAAKGTAVAVKIPFTVHAKDKVFLWKPKREESES